MSAGRHVIVGGLGNLGRHMQRVLQSHETPFCVVDRQPSSERPKHLLSQHVEFFAHNLGYDDPRNLHKMLKGADTVYSMLTPNVQHGLVSDFRASNEIGVKQLLDACKEAGVHKFVFVSSIAATNHFVPSHEQNEDHPLPPLESYKSEYDISKRRGEEAVLASNSTNLRTCALRLGGLLAGPDDYTCRNFFINPGRLITARAARIDFIGANDFSRALLAASQSLDSHDSDVAGRALFVTKCRSGKTPPFHEIAGAAADMLGWPLTILPNAAMSLMRMGAWAQHTARELLRQDKGGRVGIPPHLWMDISNHEQTFDNSLARRLLSFEPEQTWEEALEGIVSEYRALN